MDIKQQHYSMVFNTDTGSRRTMRINNPNTDVPIAEIQAAIAQMIANDVFDPQARGALESISRMELSTMSRHTIM